MCCCTFDVRLKNEGQLVRDTFSANGFIDLYSTILKKYKNPSEMEINFDDSWFNFDWIKHKCPVEA